MTNMTTHTDHGNSDPICRYCGASRLDVHSSREVVRLPPHRRVRCARRANPMTKGLTNMTSEHTGLSAEDLATTVYVVGHNLTGYIPESDLFYTTDETQARCEWAADLDRLWDSLEQIPEEARNDQINQEIDEVTAAHGDVNYVTFPAEAYVGFSSYWVEVRTLSTLLAEGETDRNGEPLATVDAALDYLNDR